jgi:hypothetical protein
MSATLWDRPWQYACHEQTRALVGVAVLCEGYAGDAEVGNWDKWSREVSCAFVYEVQVVTGYQS